MKTIPLGKGYEAIVDDDDYEWLKNYKWWVTIYDVPGYSYKAIAACGFMRGKPVFMHREIMKADRGQIVDHIIPGNTLDNRKSNLRFATASQNRHNSRKGTGLTSRFKGVSWDKTRGVWLAAIKANGKKRHIGRYAHEEDAARAYDVIAKLAFGEYAHLNAETSVK